MLRRSGDVRASYTAPQGGDVIAVAGPQVAGVALKSESRMRTLDQLKPGQSGVVVTLHGEGAIHQRLLEMGVLEGEEVSVIRLAPLGDPMEIRVQGYHLSLRKAEARLVELER